MKKIIFALLVLFFFSSITPEKSLHANTIQDGRTELKGLHLLQKKLMPKHISFIVDGNRRWAAIHGLYSGEGHVAGAEKLMEIIKFIIDEDLGIKHLSFYGFSTENWKRSKEEIDFLLKTFNETFDGFSDQFKNYKIKFATIGDLSRFPEELQNKIQNLKDTSSSDPDLTLIMALNYGGREEIKRAFSKILLEIDNGNISKEDLSEELISNYLDTAPFPDPDLIIRTSGEIRISNYLLWQLAYSEFSFKEVLWPDFSKQTLVDILLDFQYRDRRYGGTTINK